MKVSDYKKTAFALSSGYVKSLCIMSSILMVLCTILPAIQIIVKESYIQLSVFAVMMYILGELSISAMYPVFEGTEKRRSLSLNDLRTVSALYQLPADRETMVRAYISFDRYFSTMFFLAFVLKGICLISVPVSMFYNVLLLIIQMLISFAVIKISKLLESGRGSEAGFVRGIIYFVMNILILICQIVPTDVQRAEASVLSVIFGAASAVLGIIGIIVMNKIYKRMISACPNYSVSGEPITNERNDADV